MYLVQMWQGVPWKDITPLFGVFFETNNLQNLMRPRHPIAGLKSQLLRWLFCPLHHQRRKMARVARVVVLSRRRRSRQELQTFNKDNQISSCSEQIMYPTIKRLAGSQRRMDRDKRAIHHGISCSSRPHTALFEGIQASPTKHLPRAHFTKKIKGKREQEW